MQCAVYVCGIIIYAVRMELWSYLIHQYMLEFLWGKNLLLLSACWDFVVSNDQLTDSVASTTTPLCHANKIVYGNLVKKKNPNYPVFGFLLPGCV